jgi:PKD repeat protein
LKKISWVFCLIILCSIISPALAQTESTITVSGIVLPHPTPTYKPHASFTAIPQSGKEPLIVKFNDTSTYLPTSWKWEYKDNHGSWIKFSTSQSPSYTFQTGTYAIRLTVKNNIGSDTITKNNYITVTEKPKIKKPEARFSINPDMGRVPVTVTIKEKSLYNPTSYYWDFDDGTTSTLKNPPAHVYTKSGFYTIRLKVSNAGGSDTTIQRLVVLPKWWWFDWRHDQDR